MRPFIILRKDWNMTRNAQNSLVSVVYHCSLYNVKNLHIVFDNDDECTCI